MEEIQRVSGTVEIEALRQQLQGLVDADVVLPADGQWLLAALEQTMMGPSGQDALVARAGIEAFLGRVQALIDSGVLAVSDGRSSIEMASTLLAEAGAQQGSSG